MFTPDNNWKEIDLFGGTIRVDLETTRRGYATRPDGELFCDCEDCRNIKTQLHKVISQELVSTLSALGVDAYKPDEVFRNCRSENGLHSYGVMYTARGRVLIPGESGPPLYCHIQDGKHFPCSPNIEFRDRQFGISAGFEAPWVIKAPEPKT